MSDLEIYALVTTIAIVLLVLVQLIFLIVMVVVLNKIKGVADDVKQTSQMSKAFVRSLREQQRKDASLWKLGLMAFQQVKSFKRK